jgi:hypothetical protein
VWLIPEMRRRLFEWVWIGIRVIMRRWWRRRMVVTWRRWLVSVKNVLDHDGRVDLEEHHHLDAS